MPNTPSYFSRRWTLCFIGLESLCCLWVTRRPVSRTPSRTTSWKGWVSSTRGFKWPDDLGTLPWGPKELPAACSLTSFRLATHDDIRQLVSKAPTKSCELDSIPTWLLKQCGDGIIPSMTSVINMSLESGVVPGCFKKVLVRPLLKKPSLDADCLQELQTCVQSILHFETDREGGCSQTEWTCHSSSYLSLCNRRTRPGTAARQPSSMCRTISCVQWTRGRWASFSSSTCPPPFCWSSNAAKQASLGIGGTALDWFESYLVDWCDDWCYKYTAQCKTDYFSFVYDL